MKIEELKIWNILEKKLNFKIEAKILDKNATEFLVKKSTIAEFHHGNGVVLFCHFFPEALEFAKAKDERFKTHSPCNEIFITCFLKLEDFYNLYKEYV